MIVCHAAEQLDYSSYLVRCKPEGASAQRPFTFTNTLLVLIKTARREVSNCDGGEGGGVEARWARADLF